MALLRKKSHHGRGKDAHTLSEAEAVQWRSKQEWNANVERMQQEIAEAVLPALQNLIMPGYDYGVNAFGGTNTLASLGAVNFNTPYVTFGLGSYPGTAPGWQQLTSPLNSAQLATAAAVLEHPKPALESLKRIPVELAAEITLEDPLNKLAMDAERLLGYHVPGSKLKTPTRLQMTLAKLEIEILDEAEVKKYKAAMSNHMLCTGKMSDPTWRACPLKDYQQPIPEFVIAKAIEIAEEMPTAKFSVEQLHEDPFLYVHDGIYNDAGRMHGAYIEVWSEPMFESELLK